MNINARKMILLGCVDGDPEELESMIMLNEGQKGFRCVHKVPVLVSTANDNSITLETNDVILEKIAHNGVVVGSVKRCTCGKVYYSGVY